VPTSGWDGIRSPKIIIPALSLALYPMAVLARYTRSSLLEVLRTDYMRTARSKGLAERAILFRHGLRNAMLPVITIAGIVLADIATGSFFVETIYQVPGVGRYFVQSISGRDYPVILGVVLLLGLVVSVMNLVVDLLYPLLDPRIGARR
jgi:ABC-type dipeptide/oligopeptide/nickel transport system permease component